MKKIQPLPPINNPITENACRELANLFLNSSLPEPQKTKMVSERFQAWLDKNPAIVRWETLAMKERIRSLIQHPE